jgi:hypothetical protein
MCLKTQEIPQHEEKKYKSKFKYLGKAPKHRTSKNEGSKTELNYWNVACH